VYSFQTFLQGVIQCINRKLDEAIDLAYEPTLLEDGDDRLKCDGRLLITPNYVFRMKAVDAFRDMGMLCCSFHR